MANNQLLHVLVALAAVVVVARLFGFLFRRIHQPRVIGEVVGGIVLGPSLLGRIAPEAATYVIPATTAPFLSILAQLGIILYMFLIGLELDLRVLRKSGFSALLISNFSILLPFALGAALAFSLFQNYAAEGMSLMPFALFMGVSMSVTAFPVLARILNELGIHKTQLGVLALVCAAVGDVTAWCLLALVVSVLKATPAEALTTVAGTLAFIAFMIFAARPLIARIMPWFEKFDHMTESGLAIVLVGILSSALITEAIGIHAIFGAFLFGAVIPHDSKVAHDINSRLETLVSILFLPAFFAFTGLRTQISLLSSAQDWLICLAIIGVAVIGKFGGTLFAARWTKNSWRDSVALGWLMNTRGMVELIVLNIGLDLKVLSPALFTMLVIMALVTTFMTSPLVRRVLNIKTSGLSTRPR